MTKRGVVVSIKTGKKHVGNIPDYDQLPTIIKVRELMHHRLREWIGRKRTLKSLAEKSGVTATTLSRIAERISTRTTIGTIHKVAPWLGIELNAKLTDRW